MEEGMGLTIHYKLSVEKRLAGAVARELVERMALYARKIRCAEVGEVMPVEADTPGTFWYVHLERHGERSVRSLPANRGWVVDVWPGEGCESALFGLCQYPRTTPHVPFDVSTGAGSGWVLKSFCKTQYANEHGWPHFLRCHKTIVSILDFWRRLGVAVEVSDEGEYWETRSEEKLRARLKSYDGLIAAVAGVFKDAAEESGKDHSIESPIFGRKDFERLEAEGWQEFGRQVTQLSRLS
jgi:hypothetical protein